MSSKGTGRGFLAAALIAAFSAVAALPASAQQQSAPANRPAQTAPAPATNAPVKSPMIIDANTRKCAGAVCLAYVSTSSSQVNDDAEKGLTALQDVLTKKTAVHPEAVVALNIEQADLSVFNFIYWPVTANAQPLSDNARRKVQTYINRGGVILFDTMGDTGNDALRRILGDINVRPLANLDKDHTLKHAFYRVGSLSGSNDYNGVWVESPGTGGAENVTSIIVGNNNWAGAWAGRTLPKDSRERELALRSGVNIFLYSLAGDFKSDPVQKTLEKLGKTP
ncbi:MAG TPA: DUF4159 domain-containing protein [Patescibacteria group bacterium]|nr:DUF4159 domain-containing protein [Patescibacteria group bacterium]